MAGHAPRLAGGHRFPDPAVAVPTLRAGDEIPRGHRAGLTGAMKRDLKLADAAAFSVALISPDAAMALLGVGASELPGRGATSAFAGVGAGLVAYGFVQLFGHISNTGSVSARAGKITGSRAGSMPGRPPIAAHVAIGSGVR